MLNPIINEDNILELLDIKLGESYIKEMCPLGKCRGDGAMRFFRNMLAFNTNNGVLWQNELPTREEAVTIIKEKGIEIEKNIPLKHLMNKEMCSPRHILLTWMALAINGGRRMPYPLYKGYSDMIIIDSNSILDFGRICGVFSALDIFVEFAIPTAMLICCKKIKYEKDISYKGIEFWAEKDKTTFEQKYELSIDNLFQEFGEYIMYYHPVKLSKWSLHNEY